MLLPRRTVLVSLLACLLISVLGCLLFAGAANAQGFSALVSPPRFEDRGEAGSTYRNVIEISNISADPAHFTVQTADWSFRPTPRSSSPIRWRRTAAGRGSGSKRRTSTSRRTRSAATASRCACLPTRRAGNAASRS